MNDPTPHVTPLTARDGASAEAPPPRPTATQMVRSLTGWDEVAIERMFRSKVGDLSSTMAARAAVFVQLRREGGDDRNAYGQAMGMTLGEVEEGFFADEPDTDGQPGDLMGGSGKGT